MNHKKRLRVSRFGLICILLLSSLEVAAQSTSEVPVIVSWEVDGPDESASAATQLILHDDKAYVGVTELRIFEYGLDGNFINTTLDLGQYGQGIHSMFMDGDSIVIHGSHPGYDIFIGKYELDGNEVFYADVTQGQSGTGELIDVGGDLVLAWASNCCGTGQTWDTELKRFNGHTASVLWNTDLCYECNHWAGSCSHGQDYPTELVHHAGSLYVIKDVVTSPCYHQISLSQVNMNGQLEWEMLFEGQGVATKLISTPSGLLMIGHHGPHSSRTPFISLLDADGGVIWEREMETVTETPAADVIELLDGNFLFSYAENSTFHFVKLNPANEILAEYVLNTNHSIQLTTNEMSRLEDKLIELPDGQFMLAYSWGDWYESSRFSLVRFALEPPVPGCTDPTACNYDAEATSDDGSCIPSGCMEPLACNYNALAECAGEACDYTCCPGPGCCADGTSWDFGLGQCVASSSNSDPAACGPGTYWDELESLCLPIETCENDLDGDGVIGVNDLMQLLSSFGTDCPDSWTCGDPVTYHGYDYATVQIGGQCWFAENLRAEQYQNGDEITVITDIDAWNAAQTGATVVYGEGNSSCYGACDVPLNLANSGRLYNWYAAADERNLCPASWHVPNTGEWQLLSDTLGGDAVSGTSLKSSTLDAPAWDGTNETAFSAVKGGLRDWAGNYHYNDYRAYFWSSVQQGCCGAKARMLESESSSFLEVANVARRAGLSIRCLKDQ